MEAVRGKILAVSFYVVHFRFLYRNYTEIWQWKIHFYVVLPYSREIWCCSGNCKTIQKPAGNAVVKNPFLYGLTIWSEICGSSGKWKTIQNLYGKFVVENSILYGYSYISVWNRGIRGCYPNKRHFALQSAYLAEDDRGKN